MKLIGDEIIISKQQVNAHIVQRRNSVRVRSQVFVSLTTDRCVPARRRVSLGGGTEGGAEGAVPQPD